MAARPSPDENPVAWAGVTRAPYTEVESYLLAAGIHGDQPLVWRNWHVIESD
jgi:hypothetical protein